MVVFLGWQAGRKKRFCSFGAGGDFDGCCTFLLRAAYLGTLLAALNLDQRAVVLTLIGGGAFANPPHSIWQAILWAVERVRAYAPADLCVVVNGRDGLAGVPPELESLSLEG